MAHASRTACLGDAVTEDACRAHSCCYDIRTTPHCYQSASDGESARHALWWRGSEGAPLVPGYVMRCVAMRISGPRFTVRCIQCETLAIQRSRIDLHRVLRCPIVLVNKLHELVKEGKFSRTSARRRVTCVLSLFAVWGFRRQAGTCSGADISAFTATSIAHCEDVSSRTHTHAHTHARTHTHKLTFPCFCTHTHTHTHTHVHPGLIAHTRISHKGAYTP